MNARIPLGQLSTWLVFAGLGLTTSITDAASQQVEPEAITADAGQLRSLLSSVAVLRSRVEALERTNRDLTRRLDAFARRVPGERGEDELAVEPGTPAVETPTPGQVAEVREGLRFGEEVMRIVEPALAPLRQRVSFLEEQYESHAHKYISPPGMGWATWPALQSVIENCSGCLFPFKNQDKYGDGSSSGYLETTRPIQ